jgi:TPR repeat protein
MDILDRRVARIAGVVITLVLAIVPTDRIEARLDEEGRGPERTTPSSPAESPQTFHKVWYRTEHRGKFFIYLAMGDLSVGRDALSFNSKEINLLIPTDRIRRVKPMNFSDDVWTWVGVEYDEGGQVGIAAFKAPGAMARGTNDILASVEAAATATAAESGPAREHREIGTYEGHREQFTVEVPSGWFVRDQAVASGHPGRFGVIVFSAESLSRPVGSAEEAVRLANRLDTGELPSFFVDRHAAVDGMVCGGYSESAKESALRAFESPSVLGKGTTVTGSPEVERISLGGCQGLKVRVRARQKDGHELSLLVYTVSDGTTAYDFVLRDLDEFFAKNLAAFEKAVQTVKLTSTSTGATDATSHATTAPIAAASTEHRDATAALADARTAMKAGDYVTALRILPPIAEGGDAVAQNMLGMLYLQGWGVEQDHEKALSLFRKSAGQGDPKGAYNLGRMYDNAWGVTKDFAEAVKWYRASAEKGYPLGQSILGAMYASGDGVPRDYALAMKWYRLAADQGEPEAQRRVGYMYAEGQGVPKDDAQAFAWYRKAADQENVGGQYWVGRFYLEGRGTEKNFELAKEWLGKAAAQGSAEAQQLLKEAQ